MRSNNRRLIPFGVAVIIALLACGPGAAPAMPDLHELETFVANTLTALSPGEVIMDSTPPPVLIPTVAIIVPTVPALPGASDTPALPCDKASFVSETIPDGTDFAPSAAFTKTWRVRNSGTCTWNTSYAIVFDHGDSLSAPVAVAFPGVVTPGQEVDLSLYMIAPVTPGTYESFWKFRNASGVIFVAYPFSAKINVVVASPLLAYTNQVDNQVSIPAMSEGISTIDCPGGSIMTGGGFVSNASFTGYNSSMSGNGWQVYAKNNSAASELLNADAICTKFP